MEGDTGQHFVFSIVIVCVHLSEVFDKLMSPLPLGCLTFYWQGFHINLKEGGSFLVSVKSVSSIRRTYDDTANLKSNPGLVCVFKHGHQFTYSGNISIRKHLT